MLPLHVALQLGLLLLFPRLETLVYILSILRWWWRGVGFDFAVPGRCGIRTTALMACRRCSTRAREVASGKAEGSCKSCLKVARLCVQIQASVTIPKNPRTQSQTRVSLLLLLAVPFAPWTPAWQTSQVLDAWPPSRGFPSLLLGEVFGGDLPCHAGAVQMCSGLSTRKLPSGLRR